MTIGWGFTPNRIKPLRRVLQWESDAFLDHEIYVGFHRVSGEVLEIWDDTAGIVRRLVEFPVMEREIMATKIALHLTDS